MRIHHENCELSFSSQTFIGVYNTGLSSRLTRRCGNRSWNLYPDHNVKLIWMSLSSFPLARDDETLMNGDVARGGTETTNSDPPASPLPPLSPNEGEASSVDLPFPSHIPTCNEDATDTHETNTVDALPPPVLGVGEGDIASARDSNTSSVVQHQTPMEPSTPEDDLPSLPVLDIPEQTLPMGNNRIKVTISSEDPVVISPAEVNSAPSPLTLTTPVEKKGRFSVFTRIFKPWKWKRRKKSCDKIEQKVVGMYKRHYYNYD